MLDALSAWIADAGPQAWAAAPLFTFVIAVLPVPAEIPAMLNGALFGAVAGTLVTWCGLFAGAWASFEMARRGGRPLAERLVPARFLRQADRLVAGAGWPVLLALRLTPAVTFTGLNWGAGLTSMPRPTFLWTTALGILPGSIAFTAAGAGLTVLGSDRARGLLLLAVAGLLVLGAALAARRHGGWR